MKGGYSHTQFWRVLMKHRANLWKPERPEVQVVAQDLGDDSLFHQPTADISGAAAKGSCLPAHHEKSDKTPRWEGRTISALQGLGQHKVTHLMKAIKGSQLDSHRAREKSLVFWRVSWQKEHGTKSLFLQDLEFTQRREITDLLSPIHNTRGEQLQTSI